MGSNTDLFIEFLQAQLSNNGRSLGRSIADYEVSHLTGFLQENPRFTTPFPRNMAGEINPLVKLLYGEDKSQFQIHKLQDHLARIEIKVHQLESRVPECLEQRLFVGAAEVDDEYYDCEDDEDSHKKSSKQTSSSKGSKQKGKDQKGNEKKGKKKDDDENCFARLLFSKCWSGNQRKNGKAGWNLKSCCYKTGRVKKGACPAYSTCPCGDDAPCAKIEKKSCPANEKKSGGGAGGGKGKKKNGGVGERGGGGGGGSSKGKRGEKKKKDENPLSALCGKCAPCIFSKKGGDGGESKSDGWCGSCNKKKHVHTPCCCRCKDNPALSEKDKSKQSSNSKKGSKPSQKKPKESDASYDDADDDDVSVHSAIILPKKDGKDPTQEPMRCVGCTECDDIRTSGRKNEQKTMVKSTNKKDLSEEYEKKEETRTKDEKIKVFSKSSTNFQVLLPPSISNETSDQNMVSHQILKTLSTIHGPIRVEQKIAVKGTKNAFVIVTHGEACECNICSTLKKDRIPTKTLNDNSRVVNFPTDNGCGTLVNHSDNCQCPLCSVLELGINEDTQKTDMNKCSSRGVWASWSKSNVGTTIVRSSESIVQDPFSETVTTKNSSLMDCSTSDGQNDITMLKEHSRKNKNDYRKKKCHCLKCAKRRKSRRLKKKLKHALEPSDVSQLLMELSHHGFTLQQHPDEVFSMDGDDDDDTSKVSRTKRVSFSNNTKVRRYRDTMSSRSSDSKETVVPGDYKNESGRREHALTANMEDSDRRRRSKGSREVKPRFYQRDSTHDDTKPDDTKPNRPRCKSSNFTSEPCGCLVCKYPNSSFRGSTRSKALHSRPNKSEEQKCFPETIKVPSKCGCMKDSCMADDDQLREKLLDQIIHPDDDFIRPPTRCEPGCKGRCKYLTPRDELKNLRNDQKTPVVLQSSRERLPPRILYWIPSSPNLAAAFSSDSYYIPDMDEFPTGKDQSTAHSPKQNSNDWKIESDSFCDSKGSRTARDKNCH